MMTLAIGLAAAWAGPSFAARYITFNYTAVGDYVWRDCDPILGTCGFDYGMRAIATGTQTFYTQDPGFSSSIQRNSVSFLTGLAGPPVMHFSLYARFAPVNYMQLAETQRLIITQAGAGYTFYYTRYQMPFHVPMAVANLSVRGDDVLATSNTLNIDLIRMPEPQTWATLILGFGLAGLALRARRPARRAA